MFDAVNILNTAGTIITQSISCATEIVTAFPFMLLFVAMIFARKFISTAKSFTFQGRGRRRGG